MSASNKAGGYNPARSARYTPEDFQKLALVFKSLLAEEPAIKWSIIAAGIGGALEAFHIVWLAIRFLLRV